MHFERNRINDYCWQCTAAGTSPPVLAPCTTYTPRTPHPHPPPPRQQQHLERPRKQRRDVAKGHVGRGLHHLEHAHAAVAVRRHKQRQQQGGLDLALLRFGLAQVRRLAVLLHVAAHLGLHEHAGKGAGHTQGLGQRVRAAGQHHSG